jgi:signal transduction histidine kinase
MLTGRGSIQTKLIVILVLTAVATALAACLGLAFFEFRGFRASLSSDMRSIAQIVAAGSQAALTFGDTKAASETLAMLKAEPRVAAGCSYGADGKLIAQYVAQGRLTCPGHSPPFPHEGFAADHFYLTRPIELDGQRIGSIHLICSLNEMYARLTRFGAVAVAVLGGSLLFALLISTQIQKVISHPILQLAETVMTVSARGDYTVRAGKLAEDEIGVLVDRFNGMLERIQAQDEALRRAHDETEARVVERTRELQMEIVARKKTQAELERAKNAAEEANRAKSAFLAHMSHELRTPLNAVIGYSEMLVEEGEDRGQHWADEDLRRIGGAGRHLLTVINDVLDISRIEAGRMECQIEPVNIRSMIDAVVNTAEPLARRNGNRIVAECRTVRASMPADVVKFRQSLLNLLSNACKFTENGSIWLEVDETEERGAPWLRWSVRDTGIGIAPAHAEKLFRPFSQVDSSTTRKYGGTGLGLAISQRFCQLMGGRISFESEAGKGSTFRIHMPAEPAAEESGARPPAGERD